MASTNLTIGIVCPCPKEYRACVGALCLSAENETAGRPVSCRTASGLEVFAVQAGPGKINCASTTQLIIDRLRPSLVIDAGAAGGLSNQLAVNDVVCVTRSFEYDVVPLSEFPKYAAELTSHTLVQRFGKKNQRMLREYADTILKRAGAVFTMGDIASGERNVCDDTTRDQLSQMLGAVACTWETSATLKTAQKNGLPSMGFRVITDNADQDMARDFRENIDAALEILFPFLGSFLFDGWLMKLLEEQEMP